MTLTRGQIAELQAGLPQKERWKNNAHRADLCNPEKRLAIRRLAQRRYWLKHKFNISLEDFAFLLSAQSGACAICGYTPDDGENRYTKGKGLAVDHDHETQVIRGLLCDLCNRALGQFHDDPELLRKAADYIELARIAPPLAASKQLTFPF